MPIDLIALQMWRTDELQRPFESLVRMVVVEESHIYNVSSPPNASPQAVRIIPIQKPIRWLSPRRSIKRGNAVDMTLPDGEQQVARGLKWKATRDMQRAQLAALGTEKIREKVIRERPAPDPACKSTFEPRGRMWVNGFDIVEESREFCRERLGA